MSETLGEIRDLWPTFDKVSDEVSDNEGAQRLAKFEDDHEDDEDDFPGGTPRSVFGDKCKRHGCQNADKGREVVPAQSLPDV